ncbi:hypothetical protein ACHAXS_006425 [Conticribra weissflogii]
MVTKALVQSVFVFSLTSCLWSDSDAFQRPAGSLVHTSLSTLDSINSRNAEVANSLKIFRFPPRNGWRPPFLLSNDWKNFDQGNGGVWLNINSCNIQENVDSIHDMYTECSNSKMNLDSFKRSIISNFMYSFRFRYKPSMHLGSSFKQGTAVKLNVNNSLFGRKERTRNRNFTATTIPALLFFALRRVSFGACLSWAASSSLPPISRTPLARSSIQSLLRYFSKVFPNQITLRTIRRGILFMATISVLIIIKENLLASRRQKIDATSEWGRYAERPSARGLALAILLVRLIPYAIVPGLIEKYTSKKDENGKTIPPDSNPNYLDSKPHKLRKRGGEIFSEGLLRLGPLYIKIGQILSCRENLFPKEWVTSMERLQDRVPAKSGKDAWELLYSACPGGKMGFHRVFSDFDDVPLAAASLGQVHKARLRETGDAVAIKIQRARLKEIYDKDLDLMNRIASFVDKFGGAGGKVGGVDQSWTDIIKNAETILYREINYLDEAENAIRFAKDFGLGIGGTSVRSTAKSVNGEKLESASEWLRVPFTYEDLSSEKFLVMEFVPSIKVSNNDKLDAAGITQEDREYLAEALARSYLRQFVTNRFFSTDPHPGNLGVEVFDVEDRPPRLVFYDFGQACTLSKDQSLGILEVIESIVDLDAKKSVSAFNRMGVLKDNADLDKVLAKVQSNYDSGRLKVKRRKVRNSERYQKGSKQSTVRKYQPATKPVSYSPSSTKDNETNTANKSSKKEDSEVMEYFTLQSEYAFVARALSQMDGVGKGLDGEFDFISAAAPYLVEVKGARRYLLDELKKKLEIVYDTEKAVLARELALFKTLGFDPSAYMK